MKTRVVLTICVAALVVGLMGAACTEQAGARGNRNQMALQANGPGEGQPPGAAQLTEEQRQQVAEKMKEMREANNTPEEIRAAVQEMLKGWGVEPGAGRGPGALPGEGPGRGERPGGQFPGAAQLTDEQRQKVVTTMREMREAGKTPEEIRAAVDELYKQWGIERGEGAPRWQGGERGERPGGMFPGMAQLTEEQRRQVMAKMQEMREAGKTPEEIRTAIGEMLKGWGIELGAGRGEGARGGRGPQGGEGAPRWQGGERGERPGGMFPGMAQLTEEQRRQVMAKMQEMGEAGKSREEIRAAIGEMLKGWGIELGAGRGEGAGGGRGPQGGEGQRNRPPTTEI